MPRKAKRVMRGKMPAGLKQRWQKALDAAAADRKAIDAQARAVFAGHDLAREVVTRLKAERERRGLSLTDMLRRTGMSREDALASGRSSRTEPDGPYTRGR